MGWPEVDAMASDVTYIDRAVQRRLELLRKLFGSGKKGDRPRGNGRPISRADLLALGKRGK